MRSACKFQILDKTICISFQAHALMKSMNPPFFSQLWLNSKLGSLALLVDKTIKKKEKLWKLYGPKCTLIGIWPQHLVRRISFFYGWFSWTQNNWQHYFFFMWHYYESSAKFISMNILRHENKTKLFELMR